MRTISKLSAALAVAAGLTAAAVAPAFAATSSGPGQWAGTITVSQTVTMTLSSGAFSLSANPGASAYTNAAGNWASPAELITIGSNDPNGYQLRAGPDAPFATAGGATLPDTALQVWDSYPVASTAYQAFNAAGGAMTIGQSSAVSGGLGANASNGKPYSTAGNDLYPAGAGVTLPGNQSAGDYTGLYDYTLVGI